MTVVVADQHVIAAVLVEEETHKLSTATFHPHRGRVFDTESFGECDSSTMMTEMKALGGSNEEHLQQAPLCKQPAQIYADANAL